jgi:hypothetical protein
MTDPTLTDVLDGGGTPFEVSGVSFSIRPPAPEEYDDAMNLQTLVYRRSMAAPEIKELADVPCSDEEQLSYAMMIANAEARFKEAEEGSEIKRDAANTISFLKRQIASRTLAEELSQDRATLARDRWLCMRLLCDGKGEQLLDPKDPELATKWATISPVIRDAARQSIWAELGKARNAPFSLETLRGPK